MAMQRIGSQGYVDKLSQSNLKPRCQFQIIHEFSRGITKSFESTFLVIENQGKYFQDVVQ